jgi:hypothetical protein
MILQTSEEDLKQPGNRLENKSIANEMTDRHMMTTSGEIEEKS